jgi:hypothetical protein
MRRATRNARWVSYKSDDLVSTGSLVWIFFIVAGLSASIISSTRHLPEPAGYLIILAAVAASAPVFLLARRLERRLRWSAAVRVLATLALVGAQSLVLLGISSDQHRRCVDTQTMTVIPAQPCDHPAKLAAQPYQQPPAPGVPLVPGALGAQWYIGGTGMNLGDPVLGGSISRPPADDNGDGSGEDNGGSGEAPGGGDGGYEAPAGGYYGGAGEEPGGGAGDDGGEGFGGGSEGGE